MLLLLLMLPAPRFVGFVGFGSKSRLASVKSERGKSMSTPRKQSSVRLYSALSFARTCRLHRPYSYINFNIDNITSISEY